MQNNINVNNNIDYIYKKANQLKLIYHMKVGLVYCLQNPFSFLLWMPSLASIGFIYWKMELILSLAPMPEYILQIYSAIMFLVLGIILPILLLLAPLEIIGDRIAKKPEAQLQMAFREKDLRYGSPILTSKKKDKKGVTTWDFYSTIPKNVWEDRQEEIQDMLNIYLVDKKIIYVYKTNSIHIRMTSIDGRQPPSRGDLIDDEF